MSIDAISAGELSSDVIGRFNTLITQLNDKKSQTRVSGMTALQSLVEAHPALIKVYIQTIVDNVLRAMSLGSNISAGCLLLSQLARVDPESNVYGSIVQELLSLLKKSTNLEDRASIVNGLGWICCMVSHFSSIFAELSSPILTAIVPLLTPQLLSSPPAQLAKLIDGISVSLVGADDSALSGWIYDRLVPVLFLYCCHASLPVVIAAAKALAYIVVAKKEQEQGLVVASYPEGSVAPPSASADDDYYYLTEAEEGEDIELPESRIDIQILKGYIDSLFSGAYPWVRDCEQEEVEAVLADVLFVMSNNQVSLTEDEAKLPLGKDTHIGKLLHAIIGDNPIAKMMADSEHMDFLVKQFAEDDFGTEEIDYKAKDPNSLRQRKQRSKDRDVDKQNQRREKQSYVFSE